MDLLRLTLRHITSNDANFLYELMNTQKWHQFIGDRGITSVAAARKYIEEKMDAQLSTKGFINYVMIERTTNQPVGTCSIHNRAGVVGLDVGYALLPTFEGSGYASEGAKAMIGQVFSVYHQEKVSAITTTENVGSCKLLERLGFTQQGFLQLPNGTLQLRHYSLAKKDWLVNLS
ncbi:MAG: GNAT family N-acetyltransferase [Thermonemataceae bacterium]